MTTFLQRAHVPVAQATAPTPPLAGGWPAAVTERFAEVDTVSDFADVSEHAVEAIIRVGRPITDLAATPDGRTLVAIHFGDDAVSLIDTRTAAVTATINGLYQPTLAGVAGRSAYIHTSAWVNDRISIIDSDTARIVATHPVAPILEALAVSPNGRNVYVGRTGGGGTRVGVIDTATERETVIDLPGRPGASADALQVSADGRRLYVAASDPSGGNLFVVDAAKNQVTRSMRVNAPIRDIALSPDGRMICVLTCDQSRGGAVHSLNTKVDKIAVTEDIGGFPTHFTLSPAGDRLYVVDEDRVSVLCTMTNTMVDTIPVEAQPSGVAVSRNGARAYVADYAGSVTVLSTASAMPEIVFEVTELDTDAARRELEPAGV